VPSPQTKNTINLVFLTVLHSIALFSTIFRIIQRWSASHLWWDDFLLLLPLGIDATYLASLWVLHHRSCKHFPASCCYTCRFFYTVIPASALNKKIIDSFWFGTLLWLLIIWCEYNLLSSQPQSDCLTLVRRSCRTSLALSMARIFPPGHHFRRSSLTLALYFVVTFIVCIVTLSLVCRTGNEIMFRGESCIKAGVMTTSCVLFFIVILPMCLISVFSKWIFLATPCSLLFR